jgi:hypothetical protein
MLPEGLSGMRRSFAIVAKGCFWLFGAVVVLAGVVMGAAWVLQLDPAWGYVAMALIVFSTPVGLLGVVATAIAIRGRRD